MMKPNRKSSRRDFLKKGSAVVAAMGATPRALNAQTMDEETFWLQVRSQFAFTENAVPMNAANLCPSFRAVTDSVEHFTADIDRDCSFNNRAKYSDLLEHCRSRIASQLNVSADEIALVRNTSEANNMINNGLPLEAGDEILLWDQNHPPTTWPGMCAPSASTFHQKGQYPGRALERAGTAGGFTRSLDPTRGCWRSRRFPMSAVSAYLSPNWSQQHMIAEFTFMWTALSPGER